VVEKERKEIPSCYDLVDALSKHMPDIPTASASTSGPFTKTGIVVETIKIFQEKISEGVQNLTTQSATHSTSRGAQQL
jgi:hypothetical protein